MEELIITTNGVPGTHLIKKGVPFKRGAIFDKNIVLIDQNDKVIDTQTEIIKKYPDESIEWMTVSFLENSTGRENKYKMLPAEGKVGSCVKHINNTFDNGRIQIKYDEQAIHFSKGSEKLLEARVFVSTSSGKNHMTNKSCKIVAEGMIFTTLCIKGSFSGLPVHGECYITICNETERVYFETRFTAMRDVELTAQGLAVDGLGKLLVKEKNGYCISLTSAERQIIASSKDNMRFKSDDMGNGDFKETNTGFDFSPIQYGTPFLWLDGIARTIHLYINFSDTAEIKEEMENAKGEFYASLSANYYKEVGLIENINMSPTVKYTIDTINKYTDAVNGGFEAGHMPYNYNSYKNTWSLRSTRPGETEYNLWFAYMYSGDETLNGILCESAECWADTIIYRGHFKEIHGVNRYKTGVFYNTIHSRFSQPYYGDTSGLYMSYLMTGNEYFKEVFLLSIDFICSDIENNGTLLCNEWMDDVLKKSMWVCGARTRFMIQMRPLWFAYELTGDKKYKNAAEKYEKWIERTQTDEGFWYQIYDKDFNPSYIEGTQIPWERARPVKNYIMLYGSRALADYQRSSGSERIKNVLIKFADYLLTEISPKGYMWQPVANEEVYPTAEDGSRGVCPHTGIMTVTVLLDVYDLTNDKVYLEGMFALLRHYISTLGGIFEAGQLGNNRANYLRIVPRLAALIEGEREFIIERGYIDLIGIFSNDSERSCRYDQFNRDNRYMSMAEYKTPIGQIITIYYKSQFHLATYRFNSKILHTKLSDDNHVWYGGEIMIEKDACYTDCVLKGVDCKSFVKLPVRIISDEPVRIDVLYWDGKEARIKSSKEVCYECDGNIKVEVV